ncbi:hypothetical protein F5B20DRAFT_583836 [Whalleya microplaca]|nr:hypothetical protein F5B20DRAFT_583836 [Whalleya microplaca]
MAMVNPEERASAAQMLVKFFDGDGLTTPRARVPPISLPKDSNEVPAMSAGNRSPAAASPGPTVRKRRKETNRGIPSPITRPLRSDKSRFPLEQMRRPLP